MSDKFTPLTLKFHVQSLRKIPNPYVQDAGDDHVEAVPNSVKSLGASMYVAICDVRDLPGNIPTKTNPREQNLKTNVAKKIKESLLNVANPNFFLLNRGILLSAKTLAFDNATNILTVTFEDDEIHGNVDGGHTYRIIKENRDDIPYGQQFVKLEILTGIENIFQDLADARNTSNQVSDEAIAELRKSFEIIKSAVADEPFADNIAFRENDPDREIDIADVIAILNMFNIDQYNGMESFPLNSYSRKSACVSDYIKLYNKYGVSAENPYVKMKDIIPDIFQLYNMIETKVAEYYSAYAPRGRYGEVKGIGNTTDTAHPFKSKFYKEDMFYTSPAGFIYPMLGAFRALVVEQDGKYKWKKTPQDVLAQVGPDLIGTTVERSRSLGNNPQSTGKDVGNWKTLYMTVGFAAV